MKIPGLFGKSAKHHRFEYKPRYFDPKKEEHEAREERIRRELAAEKGETVEAAAYDHRTRMKGAFQNARKRTATSKNEESNTALLRLAILLGLVILLFAFFQWGFVAVYGLFLVFPIWIYFRFFKKKNSQE